MSADFTTLTSKQKKVYYAIETYIKTRGIPPTVREIGELVGEKTPGAIQGILNRLEQKGVLNRQIGMARSIKLVSENTQYEIPVYVPELKKISARNSTDLLNQYNINKFQPLPPSMISDTDNCFMINCPDNSLNASGINYSDRLIICQNYKLSNGDIILVLYKESVVLRKYYAEENSDKIRLVADSDLIGKSIFDKSEFKILGKLRGRFTQY